MNIFPFIIIIICNLNLIHNDVNNPFSFFYSIQVNNQEYSVSFYENNLARQLINSLPIQKKYTKQTNSISFQIDKALTVSGLDKSHAYESGDMLYDSTSQSIFIFFGLGDSKAIYKTNENYYGLGKVNFASSIDDYFTATDNLIRLQMQSESSVVSPRLSIVIDLMNSQNSFELESKKGSKFDVMPNLYLIKTSYPNNFYLNTICSLSTDKLKINCNFRISDINSFTSKSNYKLYEALPNIDTVDTEITFYFNIIQNCKELNNNLCNICNSGYHTSNDKSSCIKDIENCKTFSTTEKRECTECQTGYGLYSNSLCLPYYYDNCHSYENIFKCNQCYSGFSLNNFGCCLPNSNSNGCDLYDSKTQQCSACLDGYTLNSNKCIKNIKYCSTYYNGQDYCSICENGYKKLNNNNYICVKEIERCTQYDNNYGICTACESQNGYFIDNGRCIYKTDYCLEYDSDGFCRICDKNYDLTNLHTCITPINYCVYYSNVNQCGRCSKGYVINESSPRKECVKEIIGCTQYKDGQCEKCLNEYYKQDGICYKKISNCNSYSPETGKCLTCASNLFYTDNGFCLKTESKNCKIFKIDTGDCEICQDNYQLTKEEGCVPKLSYCLSYSGSRCTLCDSDHYLYNDHCIEEVKNCVSYSNDKCSQCSGELTLSAENQCVYSLENCLTYNYKTNGYCNECIDGYILYQYPQQLYCVPKVEGCTSYFYSNKSCGQCDEGYNPILSENLCFYLEGCNEYMNNNPKKCEQCDISKYFMDDDICIIKVDNCLEYKNTYKMCSKCEYGYVLQGNKCFYKIEGCAEYDQDGDCLKCESGLKYNYYYEECRFEHEHCSSYNTNLKICYSCYYGYVLQDNTCFKEIENCKNYDDNGDCLLCNDGFIYDYINEICYFDSSHCLNVGYNKCYQCEEGYELQNNTCYEVIDNCDKYDYYGDCKNCEIGYKYNYEKERCLYDYKQCKTYDTTKQICYTCNTGYCFNSKTQLCIECESCIGCKRNNDEDDDDDDSKFLSLKNILYFAILTLLFC